MPIYEYVCHECDEPFEALVLGFSKVDVKCPECDSEKVEKQISTFASRVSSGAASFNSSGAACSTGST
jgi:putative FmdB family regulatory protein